MYKIYQLYNQLYKQYGPQGWWPLMNCKDYYHILDYSLPKTSNDIFEVALGSILTQNTTFDSVIKSLHNLKRLDALDYKKIEQLDIDILKNAIKPSGYFNQKAKYILEFVKFFKSLNGTIPTRDELLNVLGIGEETADSILLFGYKQLYFKVDTYTKRLFCQLGIVDEKAKYKDIQSKVQQSLGLYITNPKKLLIAYQEFHALIVYYSKDKTNHLKSFISLDEFLEVFDIMKKNIPQNTPSDILKSSFKRTPFTILIATILSLRTKDETTAKVTKELFSLIDTPEEFIKIEQDKLEQIIRPCGTFRKKAQIIKNISHILVLQYNSKVPSNKEQLLKIKGIGEKTANIVLNNAFNKGIIAVDTHLHRITNMFGLIHTKTFNESSDILNKIIPTKYKAEFNHTIVSFGQTICLPKKPKCHLCMVKSYCKVVDEI